jgi:hypothetical protein
MIRSHGVVPLKRRSLLLGLVALGAPLGHVAYGQESLSALQADPFSVGKGVVEVDFDGTPLKLHYYKPVSYVGERFILLFHGASRTASGYRDSSSGMADAFQPLVVVPEFDLERFPSRLYQFGGVFREDGSVAGAEERTYAFVPKIIAYIRGREGDPRLAYLNEWEFDWRLVIADGPVHSPPDMFNHPQTGNALFGHRR